MTKSPFLNQLLSSGRVPSGHPFERLTDDDLILPAVDYFLSLADVPGHAEKLKEYLERASVAPMTNEASRQWASICAEIGATRLLGHELGLPIVAFERPSPRATGKKTCDIVVEIAATDRYCEVKRNSEEESQLLPEALVDAVENLQIPYDTTVGVLQRDYDCSDLTALLDAVKRHVANSPSSRVPAPYRDSRVEAIFHVRQGTDGVMQHFDPATLEDVCSFLVESGRVGRDGKPMVPMVEQAKQKAADYLLCRIPVWSGWYDLDKVATTCLAATRKIGRTYTSADPRLAPLVGVVLFERYDTFVVVNNEAVGAGPRIES